jgi:hypothetical protein
MKSSYHSLIPFLPFFFQSPSAADSLNSISSCTQAHIQAGGCLETQLTPLKWTLLYNHFARTTQKAQRFYCREGLFTAPLHTSWKLFDCCLRIRCHGNVFTEQLPSNGHLWFHYSGFRASYHIVVVLYISYILPKTQIWRTHYLQREREREKRK